MDTNLAAIIKSIVGSPYIQETDEPSIIRIRGGLGSRFFGKLETRKLALLSELRVRFSHVYIWLDDWNEDLIHDITVSGWQVADKKLWLVPPEQTMAVLRQNLFQGAWGLFFCNEPILMKCPLPHLPNDPTRLKQLFLNSNIAVAIVSWYDDNEWLVGWTVSE